MEEEAKCCLNTYTYRYFLFNITQPFLWHILYKNHCICKLVFGLGLCNISVTFETFLANLEQSRRDHRKHIRLLHKNVKKIDPKILLSC